MRLRSLLIPLGIVIGLSLACSSVPTSSRVLGIRTVGSPAFLRQTAQALLVLKSEDPGSFATVAEYIAVIRESERSGMNVHSKLPTYEVSRITAFYSVSWYASTIVHDAVHAKLYFDHLRENGPPVPADRWTGTNIEKQAIAEQLKTLRAIRAPVHEISYAEGLDGTHHDLDHDGRYSKEDYEARKW